MVEDTYHENLIQLDKSTPLIRVLQERLDGIGFDADSLGSASAFAIQVLTGTTGCMPIALTGRPVMIFTTTTRDMDLMLREAESKSRAILHYVMCSVLADIETGGMCCTQ